MRGKDFSCLFLFYSIWYQSMEILGTISPINSKPKHKYNAKASVVDGIKFDSRLEANVYKVLKTNNLNPELQKKFLIQPGFSDNGKKIRPIEYVADFVLNCNNETYVLDAKGMLLPEAKLKYKLLLYRGIRLIYIKSIKSANLFCSLLSEGKTSFEIQQILKQK